MDKTEKALHDIVEIFNSMPDGHDQYELLIMVISNYIQFMHDRQNAEIEYLLSDMIDCISSYFKYIRSFNTQKLIEYIQKDLHDQNNS